MDYEELAARLIGHMQIFSRAKPHKNIDEALHGETFVLDYIACRGGYVLPGEISDEMRVSSARVAAALNSLEQKGLITRQINKDDRRKILVGVTEHGKKMAEKHRQDVIGVAAKLLNLLGEHDAKEYVRITGKLAEIAPKCIIDSPLGQ